MFINTTIFKKMLKQAYKTRGFIIGNDAGHIFIDGWSWVIRVQEEYLTNRIKAAVVELAGEIPAPEEVFKCHKEEANQYEVPWHEQWDTDKAFDESTNEFENTRILLKYATEDLRVMQDKQNNHCIVLSEQYFNLIDEYCMDVEVDTYPVGPVALSEEGNMLFWKNNIMSVGLCTVHISEDTEEDKRLRYLSGRKF